jgi:hypothetical protein
MAQTVSLLDLRTEVRRQTDAVNDPHLLDAELNAWINKGLRVLFGCIIAADPDFYLTTTTISTTAGTQEYALPADFRALRLLALTEAGRSYRLRPFAIEELYRRSSVAAGGGFRPRYRVARNGVDGSAARVLFDVDPGTRTYTLHYVPVPPALAADGDLVDGVLGFDDYAIAYAACRVRRKRDEDPSLELAEMARVERDVAALAKQRHLDGEDTPARVRRRFRSHHHDEETFP